MKYIVKVIIVVEIFMISFGAAYQHCSSVCKTQPAKYICSSAVAEDGGELPNQLFGESGLTFRNGCEMACFNRAQITRGLGAVKKIKDGPCITILGDLNDDNEDGFGDDKFNNLDN